MKLAQKEFEKAWKEKIGDSFLQKEEKEYTCAATFEAYYWFEKGFNFYHETLKESSAESFGSYWDEVLDNKNALIKHLMDENRRLDKENDKLKGIA